MTPIDVHKALLELAGAAGFEVRRTSGRAGEDRDLPIASGVCRVRDRVWVVLATGDSLEEHSEVLVQALQAHASELLESRYLAPALRERLGV